MHLGTRQVPEIDGSRGAFIGLVVALSVLIVICCAAVFYLLRHHEPTEQDRTLRRQRSSRYRQTQDQALQASLSLSGPSTSTLVGSLGDKVKQLWQSTAGRRGMGRPSRRGGRGGWIRAGSNDEWATHSESDRDENGDPEELGRMKSLPPLKQDAVRTDKVDAGSGSGSGNGDVRVVESPLSESDGTSGFVHAPYVYPYTDPFSKTSGGVLHRSQSPLSSPASSPREYMSREGSQEGYSPGDDGQRRHRSIMSDASVWTHGSKFVEDI